MVDSTSAGAAATFGAGCFWCVEAIFQALDGVLQVESGYAGGARPNPTYQQVCSGSTGHAEVVRIIFDPACIKYEELLEVFFHTHDPTTLNRQGNDIGTQYRSVIFFHDEVQKAAAERVKRAIEEVKLWPGPIVTEIVPLDSYYSAEEYHQNYFNRNPTQSYCLAAIPPKLAKLKAKFGAKLKLGTG